MSLFLKLNYVKRCGNEPSRAQMPKFDLGVKSYNARAQARFEPYGFSRAWLMTSFTSSWSARSYDRPKQNKAPLKAWLLRY